MTVDERANHGIVPPGPPALILLYHQVGELDGDPQRLAVSPTRFAEHLEVIRRFARPTRLRELLDARSPSDGDLRVVVTFDDGYADNLTNAKPLLEAYDVPATVFVTSGAVEGDREFWWDELDQIVLRSASLPGKLRLRLGENSVRWRWRGEAARSAFDQHPAWTVERDDHDPRHALYRELCNALRRADAETRRRALDELAAWAGVTPIVRPARRTLITDELREIADGDLVEIGAHTVTHTMLSALRPSDQRCGIRQSRAELERIIGRPVSSFAYPFGTRTSYNAATVSAVQDAGFACACSNFEGVIRGGVSVFELPRFLVRDWGGERFQGCLLGWLKAEFGAVRKAADGVGSLAGCDV